jgi:glutamyl-tRNA synthetase
MSRRVRVRFAPSPTGPLHIGGVRTALFNYLFAKKHHGDFILRIEDTDQGRFVPGAEEYIVKSLKWLQIFPNEGIGKYGKVLYEYKQSNRRYKSFVNELIRMNKAYYAFDTPEELDEIRKQYESKGEIFQYDSTARPLLKNSLSLGKEETKKLLKTGHQHVIRFRIPEKEKVIVTDMIRGKLKFNTSSLDDKVLFKSDGLPTYHLANVVDDHLMNVTHVIRGEEWLPSLPLHVLLYKAFGWKRPKFAHLPLILKPSGQGKLSKRDGDKLGFPVFPLEWTDPKTHDVSTGYLESGYSPEAMLNILAFLGWNPGTEQELLSLTDLVDNFNFDRVGKSGARFDLEKAKWYNQQYFKNKSDKEIAKLFQLELKKRNIHRDLKSVIKVVSLVKERIVFPQDLWNQSFYFFEGPLKYDEQMQNRVWKNETPTIMVQIKELLQNSVKFSSTYLESLIKKYTEEKGIGFGMVMAPLRLLLVGSAMGPHLFDIMEMIGKEETIRRIDRGLGTLK